MKKYFLYRRKQIQFSEIPNALPWGLNIRAKYYCCYLLKHFGTNITLSLKYWLLQASSLRCYCHSRRNARPRDALIKVIWSMSNSSHSQHKKQQEVPHKYFRHLGTQAGQTAGLLKVSLCFQLDGQLSSDPRWSSATLVGGQQCMHGAEGGQWGFCVHWTVMHGLPLWL